MTYQPPLHVHSLVRFWWDAVSYLAARAEAKLNLFPIPSKPFLPRRELTALSGLVAFLEPVLRRIFYLMALELGPLSPRKPPASAPSAHPVPRPTGHRETTSPPRFRLVESERTTTPKPPAPIFRTGPRIRFLDESYPVDLRDYPAGPDDLLPSKKLVRRLIAINHALQNAAKFIAAMRRHLGHGNTPLRQTPPPSFKSRALKHLQQESALELHNEMVFSASADTS